MSRSSWACTNSPQSVGGARSAGLNISTHAQPVQHSCCPTSAQMLNRSYSSIGSFWSSFFFPSRGPTDAGPYLKNEILSEIERNWYRFRSGAEAHRHGCGSTSAPVPMLRPGLLCSCAFLSSP
jgi:hypothetical protein